jgi:hypothetical protein
LTQPSFSLVLRLVRGGLLLRQRRLSHAEIDYTTVTDNWKDTMPIGELDEAQCGAKNIIQNPTNATLKVTCEPLSTLIAAR